MGKLRPHDKSRAEQREIYEAVVARGYRDGWTAEQFAARQVAKLAEELGELARYIHQWDDHDSSWELDLADAAEDARAYFDDGPWLWRYAAVEAPYDAIEELADIVVVACCLAEALGEHESGMDVDLMQLAMAKARADVGRGVRGEEGG